MNQSYFDESRVLLVGRGLVSELLAVPPRSSRLAQARIKDVGEERDAPDVCD